MTTIIRSECLLCGQPQKQLEGFVKEVFQNLDVLTPLYRKQYGFDDLYEKAEALLTEIEERKKPS